MGAFALQASLEDVYTMAGAGLLGYAMQKLGFPVAPIVLALILGPMAEANWDRSVLMGLGSAGIFLRRPIALALLALAAVSAAYPLVPLTRAFGKHRTD